MFAGSFMPLYCLKFRVGDDEYTSVLYKEKEDYFKVNNGSTEDPTNPDSNKFFIYEPKYNPSTLLSELYYRNKEGNSYSDYESNKIKVGDIIDN
jgi:hypothetical protein|nr:MAG TPA: hypothetical protein [Bacteriophage sp.]